MLDIAARRLGIDPVDLRRRNLLRSDEMPYANANGMTYSDVTPLETFEHALEHARLRRRSAASRPRHAPRAATSASARARYVEPTASGMALYGSEGATIRIEPSGAVNVYVAGGSAGNSLETTAIQLDRRRARRRHRRRAHDPGRHRAHAVRRRHRRQPQRLDDRRRRPRHGGDPARADRRDRRPRARGVARRHRARRRSRLGHGVAVAERDAGRDRRPRLLRQATSSRPTSRRASRRAPATAPRRSASGPTPPTCAPARSTSRPARSTLLRYVVGEDCGPMINPNVVEGQIAGGTVQGIGGVLLEDFPCDEDGNPLATTFVDYLLPTIDRGADRSSTATSEGSPGPGPGRLQGRRRGRRDRRARRRRQRGRRRARAARRDDHPPAAHPGDDRRPDRRGQTPRRRRPMKPAPFDYHAPDDDRRGPSRCSPSSTTPRSSPAGRASSRCWRCASPPSSTSSTSAASRSCAASNERDGCGADRRRDHPGRRSSATPTSLGAVPLAGPRRPVDRALPDPQPRHDRRLARPRRPRRRATRRRARARRRVRGRVAARPPRTIPAAEFFTGTWTTALGDDELLTGVGFPIWTGRCGFAVEEVARRHGDFAIAGACVAVELDGDGGVRALRDRAVRPRLDAGAGRPPPSSRCSGCAGERRRRRRRSVEPRSTT